MGKWSAWSNAPPTARAIRDGLYVDVIDNRGNDEEAKQDEENDDLAKALQTSDLADLVTPATGALATARSNDLRRALGSARTAAVRA